MKQIRWNAVSRKRLRNARYTDPEYVVGYDLDTHDMDELVAKFNANNITETESNRLGRHVLTLMQIVVENPKFLSRPKDDYEELTDYMFLKMWGAIKYIDITKGRAYSYLYRSGYTAVASYYQNKNKVDEREKQIDEYLQDVWQEYDEDYSDHKVVTSSLDQY